MLLRALAASLLLITVCEAQISRTGAALRGTVTDPTGAAVAGAQITLHNLTTGQSHRLASDAQGRFQAYDLPVGTYVLRVQYSGFATYIRKELDLSIGQLALVPVQLRTASAQQEITVSGAPPMLESSQTVMATTVDKERIEELPVRTRNYLDFVLLASSVAPSHRTQAVPGQAALPDSGFSFGGLRGRSNNLLIDGLDNNDEFTGANRTEISLEDIGEFQIVNNGLSAETGGASGGSIDVVTRDGSNLHHGDAFLFVQNGSLDARPALTNQTARPDLDRYRVGFALGGPIRRNRTFYYTAFEQEHNRAQDASDIVPSVADFINRRLAAGAFPGLPVRQLATGFFPATRAETEASAKFNHQISDRHSLMLRYAFTNNREAGDAFNTSGLADVSSRGSSFTEDHALVGSLASVISPSKVNDLRFQLATRRVVSRSGQQNGPLIEIPGSIEFGRPYNGNDHRRENQYELLDTLALQSGAHLLKAGFAINRIRLRTFSLDGFGGLFVFPTLPDFLAGRPEIFRQAFGNPRTDFPVTALGGFLQDHWMPTPRLTLNLGLRYDFERLPAAFNRDINNFSPRLGLAYSPGDNWVLRAGYGIFFDRYVLAAINPALTRNGVLGFEQVVQGGLARNLFQASGGGSLPLPVPGVLPSITVPQPGLPTPYSQQTNFGVERLLNKNTSFDANYLFVRGVKLSRTLNANLLPPVLLTPGNAPALGFSSPTPQQLGREVFGSGRNNSLFNDIYQLQDAASSTYNGLSLRLNRRMVDEVEFSGSYTFSKTLDNASDFNEQAQNPFNLAAERALSLNDLRHRFTFSGLFELPFGDEEDEAGAGASARSSLLDKIFGHLELAPILTLTSGRPQNPLTGLDSNRNDALPLSSRPLGWARDSLRTPAFAELDLRLLKYFYVGEHGHLDVVAESFNLLNRTNVTALNPFFGGSLTPGPGFAQPLDAGRPRQLQFSLDYEF